MRFVNCLLAFSLLFAGFTAVADEHGHDHAAGHDKVEKTEKKEEKKEEVKKPEAGKKGKK